MAQFANDPMPIGQVAVVDGIQIVVEKRHGATFVEQIKSLKEEAKREVDRLDKEASPSERSIIP